jgi:hypothetical protein
MLTCFFVVCSPFCQFKSANKLNEKNVKVLFLFTAAKEWKVGSDLIINNKQRQLRKVVSFFVELDSKPASHNNNNTA